MPHAEIAGAGFAGLVAATALTQRGWSARVHEKGAELRAFGAGIFIWENGLRVLKAIGAYDDVIAGSHEAFVYEIRQRNEIVESTRFAADSNDRMLTMTRQTLYAALLRAAEKAGVEVVVGSKAAAAEPGGALLTAAGRRCEADLVVGADGVGSRVRDSLSLLKERDVARIGIVRILAPRCLDEFGDGAWHHVIDSWNLSNRSLRILYVPCNEQELYMAMMAPVTDAEATAVPLRQDIWTPAFPQFEPAIRRASADGRYDPYETGRLTRWSSGRVAIVGDAAHAMVPSLGQGAGIAMMNALSLAVEVDRGPTVESALDRWERAERPHTERVQHLSRKAAKERMLSNGRLWNPETKMPIRVVPSGTEHLPRRLD